MRTKGEFSSIIYVVAIVAVLALVTISLSSVVGVAKEAASEGGSAIDRTVDNTMDRIFAFFTGGKIFSALFEINGYDITELKIISDKNSATIPKTFSRFSEVLNPDETYTIEMKVKNILGQEAIVKSESFKPVEKKEINFIGSFENRNFKFIEDVKVSADGLRQDGQKVRFPDYKTDKAFDFDQKIEECSTIISSEKLEEKESIGNLLCNWDASGVGWCLINDFSMTQCYMSEGFVSEHSMFGVFTEIFLQSDPTSLKSNMVGICQDEQVFSRGDCSIMDDLSNINYNSVFKVEVKRHPDLPNEVLLRPGGNPTVFKTLTFSPLIFRGSHGIGRYPDCAEPGTTPFELYRGSCSVDYSYQKVCPMGYKFDIFEGTSGSCVQLASA